MFCPKCATQNIDGAGFCRQCGANISLVPQALTGQLPTAPAYDYRALRRQRKNEASLEHAIRSLMMGVAFVVISILVGRYSPGGWTWWYWLLIPATAMFGQGIAQLIRLQQTRGTNRDPRQIPNRGRIDNLAAPRTGELMPPAPSVTEGTTRHLGAEAATRPFDSFEDQRPS